MTLQQQTLPLWRATDPETSRRAGERFTKSGAEHGQRYIVLTALHQHGPMNTHRLAEATGLRVDQLDRRAKGWEESGLIVRRDEGGPSLTWEAI